jgi:folate-binding protein YgfZ
MLYARELDWLESSVGVLAPTDRAIVSVSGEDAYEWLQGQITNQCEGTKPGDSVYAFVLTLKGRVLADVWALFHDDGIWLDAPASQIEALLERLDRYVIMEDVDLEHRADLRLLVAQGPRAGDAAPGGWAANKLGTGGRQWVVPEAELDAELERTTSRAADLGGGRIGEEAWRHAHVVRGRPRFGVDFGDWTYPQESGLTSLAVSFNKGCYIGQETVVMLENRGKAPKVLWRWAIAGDEEPPPSTAITKDGAVVGEVTSAAPAKDGIVALGFLKRGHEPENQAFEISGQTAHAIGPVSEGPAVAADAT